MKPLDMTQHDKEMAEIREIMKNTAISQAKTDIALTRLEQSQAKTDAAITRLEKAQLKTDAQLAQTDKKLKEVGMMLGNYGLVQGEISEEEVYRYVSEALSGEEKTFDEVVRNMKKRGIAEYDIVAVNGSEVMPIEVKNKLKEKDIDHFIDIQLPKFKKAFPRFNNYDVIGGVAGKVVRHEVEEYAIKKGLYVFVTSPDTVTIANKKGFKAKVFR